MPTLAQRDTSGTFGARAGELCELPDRRTRSAKVFRLPDAPDGRKRYRIGAGIGPVHYPHDVWSDAPNWHEIDTEVRPVTDGTCDYAMLACGYAARFWQRRKKAKPLNYIGEFSRGGATYRMAPLSLSWQDAEGAEETISTPTGGIAPKLDAEAGTITWEDAFGAGLSYGYNCCPDKLFKVLTVRDRASLPAPKRITPARLVLRLWVSWDGEGAPDEDLPAVAGGYQQATTAATTHRPAGRYAHKHLQRDLPCFWVQPPEAWDSGDEEQQRWPLDWWYERRRQEVVLCLALDVAALEAAAYPLLMDTAISEEQVGASADDATATSALTNWDITATYKYINYTSMGYVSAHRFTTIPIPAGATIDSASLSFYIYAYDDVRVTIKGEDVDNADAFTTSEKYSGMALTTANVTWSADNIGTAWRSSPSVADIVTEVTGREGWSEGNAIAFTTKAEADASAICRIYFWDYTGNARGAKFNCSYTESGPLVAYPAAATRTATAYAPTAVPGTIAALPGVAARTPIAYQPSAVQVVAVALAARTAEAFAPTAVPGAVAALPNAATRSPTAYSPTALPGSITAEVDQAARSATAYAPTALPGAIPALVECAARTAVAYQPSALPGSVAALPAAAARTPTAYEVDALPGTIAVLPGSAERTPTAYAATALPGAVVAQPAAAARSAQAFEVTGLPGPVVVYVDAASRTPTAYQPTAAPGPITAQVAAALRSATAYDVTALPGAVVAAVAAALRTAAAYDATAELTSVPQTAYPGAALRTPIAYAPYPVTWDVTLLQSQGRLADGYLESDGRLAEALLNSQGRLAVAYIDAQGRLAVGYVDSQGRLAVGYLNSDGRQS